VSDPPPGGPPAGAIARIPKAELHVHLEGTAAPPARGGARESQPAGGSRFTGFLDDYCAILDSLRSPEDYGRLAARYLEVAPDHGIRHVEFTLSLGAALGRGHEARPLLEAIRSAAERRLDRTTVTVLVDAVRQFGPDEASRTLEAVLPHLDLGIVSGFGLGGDERALPAAAFRAVFERARAHGLRTTVHAGEACGAASVLDAIVSLRPDRIAHGIAAARDPRLLERLARAGTTLDICPTSNLATGAVDRLAEHPLPAILAAGVPVTIGTDDPGMFATDLTREYRLAARIGGLDLAALERIASHSLRAAFPPAAPP
jgi:aminodeoxyfutalosine deaminase